MMKVKANNTRLLPYRYYTIYFNKGLKPLVLECIKYSCVTAMNAT